MADTRDTLLPLIHKLQRLGRLSPDDIAAIQALPCTVQQLHGGDMIVRQGDVIAQCTLLITGLAARTRLTRDGARQMSGLYICGDLVDLPYGLLGFAHDNVEVFGTAEVARIPLDALTTLAFERPSIGRLLWIDSLIDASIAREWTLNLGRRDARTRLLHLLCEYAIRREQAGLSPRELTLPLSQEQLADALGLTAVHVNRILQSLRAEPALERDGRTIRIKDWRRLASKADFNDAYMTVGSA